MTDRVITCGGNTGPGKRDSCPSELHDYPTPDGYGDFFAECQRRISRAWKQVKCKNCGLYGWVPPQHEKQEVLDALYVPHPSLKQQEQ